MVRGSRRYRLTGTGVFEALLRSGVRRDGEYLQLVSTAAAREYGRAGFVIGRKALPRAVDRNRLRRMLRARMDAARPAIAGYDLIVRLKRRAPRANFGQIAAEGACLLASLTPPAPAT
jgi:ribonuclease P protein component